MKIKNIITTMGSPKLPFSSAFGFMPPISINARRPAILGQTISINTHPYKTPKKIPIKFIPNGVRGSTAGS